MVEPTPHISRVIDNCLEQIQQGSSTLDDCLKRHPEHRDELTVLLPLALDLGKAPRLELTQAEIEKGRGQLLAQLPERSQQKSRSWPFLSLIPIRRFNMAWILVIATVFSMVAGGGLVYASDGAVPGDALYGLDRMAEEIRLELTRDPSALFELHLDFSTERLEEVQALAAQGDAEALSEALAGYQHSVSQAMQFVSDSAQGEAMGQQLELAVAKQEGILVGAGLDEGEPAGVQVQIHDRDRDNWCLVDSEDLHPVIEGIVETYEISPTLTYETVLDWFCEGNGLGEIMIALKVSQETGLSVEELLALQESGTGWGQILRDLELIGGPQQQGPPEEPGKPEGEPGRKPEGAGPWHEDPLGPGDGEPTDSGNGGKPDDAGPPGQGPNDDLYDRPVGPPDDSPGSPPENPPVGPPDSSDETPVGPPDGSPGSPPENPPVGPPDDSPGTPPDNPPGEGGSGKLG